jgi:simple sugar transport system ATP-binding protein
VQQRVEIIKALSRDAQVLVLDEPTAVLTPQETDELMEIMRQLKAAGKAIVFITHKLREVREVADRITVIRLGKVVGEAEPTASNAELASLMVGRPVELTVHKNPAKPGADALVVEGLRVIDAVGRVHVDGVSFTIRSGEILAVAGVQGNGQTELTEALLGLEEHVEGSVRLHGEELVGRSVRHILEAGVGFIPEDRQVEGLVGEFTIAENLMLNRSYGPPFVRHGSLALDTLETFAKEKVKEYDVRAPGITTLAGQLSGGRRWSSPGSSRATCRSSWPPSRREASTWARSSSSTSRSWRAGMPVPRSSWSPPSWTRSSRWRIASWCSTGAESSASSRATRHVKYSD